MEEKQEVISKYLFGVAIMRASTNELEESMKLNENNIAPKNKDQWLSELRIVK